MTTTISLRAQATLTAGLIAARDAAEAGRDLAAKMAHFASMGVGSASNMEAMRDALKHYHKQMAAIEHKQRQAYEDIDATRYGDERNAC